MCRAALAGWLRLVDDVPMGEERRLVTVLFADVIGSTAMGEELDPEELRALLARYYAIAREVIPGYGGLLEKFIGDAVMAVFGIPAAHGDDPSRAVGAALELRDRVRGDPLLGERLPIRIGVNTGEVVAAREAAAESDFILTGDAVNVTARLVQSAEPWTVVAGERTVRAAREYSYGSLRAIDARGKQAAVRAAIVRGKARVEHRLPPIVGREPDLAELDLVARRAFGERRPYLVNIIAPAGTGKTRLLEEFLSRLARDWPDCLVATAQCMPYGQRLTYWPMRSILHRLCDTNEDTSPDELRSVLESRLAELKVAHPELIATRLLATIGEGEAEVIDRADLYAAWRTTFEKVASTRPLVVVFEDLHWSSDSFLDLVENVTQPHGDEPLLILALARGELLDRRPAWGGGRRNQVTLALDPLDDASMAQVVRNLFESAGTELTEAVTRRAEGNPFYAGELIRAVIERFGSNLEGSDLAASLASLPDTVQAAVLARIDALPERERHALQLGSVFGSSFRAEGLVALEPQIASDLEALMTSLTERDMIREADDGELGFRHILIPEVAYGTLPRSQRARLHLAAARWLEREAAGNEDAYAELIAYHAHEAATLASMLGTDDAREAIAYATRWLRAAAETALGAAADVEARGHLIKAIEWASDDVLPDIYERIGDTWVGGDATVSAYAKAYRLACQSGRPPDDRLRMLAKQIAYETRFRGSVGTRTSPKEMDRLIAQGRSLASVARSVEALARFHIGIAFIPWWRLGSGLPSPQSIADQAAADAQVGLRLAEESGDPLIQNAALDAVGSLALDRGDWAGALGYYRRRHGLRNRLPVPERLDADTMLAWSLAALGHLSEAEQVSTAGLQGLQPGQSPSMALNLVTWLTHVLFELGRWDEVPHMARRAAGLWVETGRGAALYAVRGFLAAFDVARARRDAAEMEHWRSTCEAIFAHGSGVEEEMDRTRLYLRGDVSQLAAALGGRLQGTLFETYTRWLGMCTDLGCLPKQASIRAWLNRAERNGEALLLGEALRAMAALSGEPEHARRALALFDAAAALPRAARVRCELGLRLGDEELYRTGAQTLESLGDVDQLQRYEARRSVALRH